MSEVNLNSPRDVVVPQGPRGPSPSDGRRAVFSSLARVVCLAFSLVWGGCDGPLPEMAGEDATVDAAAPGSLGKADGWGPEGASELPSDFPSEQDLAILVPTDMEPPIDGSLTTQSGGTLLSEGWLSQVSAAYEVTDVGDALDAENWYEDWRLVSVRIATCGPLGTHPGQFSEDVCWPQVRLVWQPVIEGFHNFGIPSTHYADDRAIHALYRVHPDARGRGLAPELRHMRSRIAAGESVRPSPAFIQARDRAIRRLAVAAADLRGARPVYTSWERIGMRAEYAEGDFEADAFHVRLSEFARAFATPEALHELTSFSLPEGRSPASIDSWVFLAFEGEDGRLRQKDLTVRSRHDGRVLVNLGPDQTVTTAGEDEAVVEAMGDPAVADELRTHVFLENSDADHLGDLIADPQRTFVSNTSCATCHRLTDLSFDFHTFSYFEDRAATISPRVEKDVANDLRILRAFLAEAGRAGGR